jgi:UDPglucose 6-dehydrogenase
MARISVIGAGYVGLVTAACLAELGHSVVGLEINESRLQTLSRGELPIYEPGLSDLFAKHFQSGRLRFTRDYAATIPQSDFVFIAVNTPSRDDGSVDTRDVFSSLRTVLRHARPGLVVVLKSTVPVGTGDQAAVMADESGVPGIAIVSNPEFLREGSAVADFLRPDRIVIGVEDPSLGDLLARVFSGIDAPIVVCRRRSAELAKYASNALLAARISLINEIAGIAGKVGAEMRELVQIVGADHRIGPSFLGAGLGWGGSCFPKDVRGLIATAEEHGDGAPMLRAVVDVNSRQRELAFGQLRDAVAGRPGATVAVLGLAFKPGTDDIRESPALDVIGRLVEEGIRVRAHDPVAVPNARRVLPVIDYCESAYEAALGADALLLATDWPEYVSLDWSEVHGRMRGRLILDGRQALDGEHLSQLGFTYAAVGEQLNAGVQSCAARAEAV